jgi:uncharacterized protein YggE
MNLMKNPLLCLSAVIFATVCSAAEIELPHVSVFGTAVTEVQPDLLRWRVSIACRGLDVTAVADEHTSDVAAALAFLKQQGILPAETQTARMQLSEHREYRNNSWVKEGYDASTDIAFTSKDLSAYRGLWLGLSKLKGATINSAAWDSSKRIEVQNTTRLDALKAAKEKATAMVSALGVRLAEPLAIEELPASLDDSRYNRYAGNNFRQLLREGSDADGDAVAPGSIEIRVRVKVAFRIVSN